MTKFRRVLLISIFGFIAVASGVLAYLGILIVEAHGHGMTGLDRAVIVILVVLSVLSTAAALTFCFRR